MFNGLPSDRLRADLAGLESWARLADPNADECDYRWDHYATNIRRELQQLDHEFSVMKAENAAMKTELVMAETEVMKTRR